MDCIEAINALRGLILSLGVGLMAFALIWMQVLIADLEVRDGYRHKPHGLDTPTHREG